MVAITTLFIRIKTGWNGTDGNPFIGLHGREFYIDSKDSDINDFEQGSDRTYICGQMPQLLPPNSEEITMNTKKPQNIPWHNNPQYQHYTLDTDNLGPNIYPVYPVYLRFEPDHEKDTWVVSYVSVEVNPTPQGPIAKYEALGTPDDDIALTLGPHFGTYVYLHQTIGPSPG